MYMYTSRRGGMRGLGAMGLGKIIAASAPDSTTIPNPDNPSGSPMIGPSHTVIVDANNKIIGLDTSIIGGVRAATSADLVALGITASSAPGSNTTPLSSIAPLPLGLAGIAAAVPWWGWLAGAAGAWYYFK